MKSTYPFRLFGLGDDPEVRLHRFPAFGVFLLRLIIGHGWDDDDVLTVFPIDRSGYFVFGRELLVVPQKSGVLWALDSDK